MRLLSLFIVLFVALNSSVYAQEANGLTDSKVPLEIPKGDFNDLKHTKSGRIDKVIDGLTLLLKDGTIIRLASIDIPDFNIWRDAPYSEAALELLQKTLPERTEVMIYQTRMAKKGQINRMKQELAHVVVKDKEIWLQGLLLANGLARVYTAPNATEMSHQMLKIEQDARAKNIGLWENDSEYLILTPENAESAIGQLAIIEGTVTKAASVRNNIYLNFGKDWKKDFTVMLTPALRKELAKSGTDPLGMAQQKLRVRGWLREYNGPLIELEDISHLEYPLNDTPLQKTEEQPNLEPNP